MPLKSLIFTEPGPYNSGKDLVPGKVDALLEIDLADYSPALKQNSDGEYLIPVFTDLKRHKMGDELNNELLEQDDVPTDEWLTKKLWGFVSEPPFSTLRAATKTDFGSVSARMSSPPGMSLPLPRMLALNARPRRVSESSSMAITVTGVANVKV